jgi:uncharacterized protein (DUF2267 family)
MKTTRRLVQVAGIGAGVIGTIAVTAPESAVGQAARRCARRLTRDLNYVVASAPGIAYRLAGRRPDPDADDAIVADRVRSALGPLEKRLDLPRLHVMVDDHYVILHGEVASEDDAYAVERAVMRVSGVDGYESHLHVGLLPGDTRPSAGRAAPQPPSAALTSLTDAAERAGARDPRAAVHAVLCGFFDRIPIEERLQVSAHLPADVRALAGPARRGGATPPKLRTVTQLVSAVTAEGGIDPERTEAIMRATIAALRDLVPEEAADIAAVLPAELRDLWKTSASPYQRSEP